MKKNTDSVNDTEQYYNFTHRLAFYPEYMYSLLISTVTLSVCGLCE